MRMFLFLFIFYFLFIYFYIVNKMERPQDTVEENVNSKDQGLLALGSSEPARSEHEVFVVLIEALFKIS